LKIRVVEDKSDASTTVNINVEAQLIADAIAIYQSRHQQDTKSNLNEKLLNAEAIAIGHQDTNANSNEKLLNVDANDHIVFGVKVKVKGMTFTFYIIPITEQILNALSTCCATHLQTEVRRFGPFKFQGTEDRNKIVKTLDYFRAIAKGYGERNVRRNSASNK
jgi:co-chaperonin GroES (HSP10)